MQRHLIEHSIYIIIYRIVIDINVMLKFFHNVLYALRTLEKQCTLLQRQDITLLISYVPHIHHLAPHNSAIISTC